MKPLVPWQIDRGLLAALLAPFFIALSIILTKLAGNVAQPLVIAGLGSLISVPCLLLMHKLSRSPLQLKKLVTELKVPFLKVLLSRSVFGQALIIAGFTLTTAVKAVLLLRLEPIFVFGWSVLWRQEEPHPRKVALLSLLLLGSILVVAPQGSLGGPNIGDALVVASLLFLSYSYFPTQEVVAQASPAGLNILTCLVGGAILTVCAAFFCARHDFELSAKALLLITSYSVVFFVIASTLYYHAFKSLKPWVIASFLSLEVVFGLALAALLLHESMAPMQCLGALIVLAATFAIGRLAA